MNRFTPLESMKKLGSHDDAVGAERAVAVGCGPARRRGGDVVELRLEDVSGGVLAGGSGAEPEGCSLAAGTEGRDDGATDAPAGAATELATDDVAEPTEPRSSEDERTMRPSPTTPATSRRRAKLTSLCDGRGAALLGSTLPSSPSSADAVVVVGPMNVLVAASAIALRSASATNAGTRSSFGSDDTGSEQGSIFGLSPHVAAGVTVLSPVDILGGFGPNRPLATGPLDGTWSLIWRLSVEVPSGGASTMGLPISRPTESAQVGPAPAALPSSSVGATSTEATGEAPSSAVVAGEPGAADPNASDVPTLDVGALPTVRAGAPAPSRRTVASDEELTLTLALRSAVDRAPVEALVLADEGDRRFANGALVEERAVLRIAALARLGRDDEAKARAKDFVARFPKSPLRHRALGHARLTD